MRNSLDVILDVIVVTACEYLVRVDGFDHARRKGVDI